MEGYAEMCLPSGARITIDLDRVDRIARWASRKCGILYDEDVYQSVWAYIVWKVRRFKGDARLFWAVFSTTIYEATLHAVQRRYGKNNVKKALYFTNSLDVPANPRESETSATWGELLTARDGDPIRPAMVRDEVNWILKRIATPHEQAILKTLLRRGGLKETAEALGVGISSVSGVLDRVRTRLGIGGKRPRWPRHRYFMPGSKAQVVG